MQLNATKSDKTRDRKCITKKPKHISLKQVNK